MPDFKAISILLLMLGIFFSCSEKNNTFDKTVAKVGDKVLHISDVNNFIPKGINKSDSILMAEDYVKRWIQKELLIKKAEENLSTEEKNVSKELEEYRNSLIIFKYKNEMVKQKMDTTVSTSEIEDYYSNNTKTFILNKNIVKAIYLKIPNDLANPEQLKLYCDNKSDENFNELKEYCLQYAKSFDAFNDSWIDLNIVLNSIPNTIQNQERFLTRNELMEISDSAFYYLFCVNDYRLSGQPAPISYVNEQIKNLILNKRKINFLKNIEIDIYNEGVRTKKFNIYD
jgi:hypothetical protein